MSNSEKKRKSDSAALRAYKNVMKALRRNHHSGGETPTPYASQRTRPYVRFVDSDKEEEKDDWLIDDRKAIKRKKSRVSSLHGSGFGRSKSCSSLTNAPEEQRKLILEPYQPPTTSTITSICTTPVVPAPVLHEIKVILDTGETYTVHYDQKLISTTQTVEWLRNAVALQYIMKHGKDPSIKLYLSDGCVTWADSDTLQKLLKHNSPNDIIVRGKVCGRNHINLEQFYDEYCQAHNLETDVGLRTQLLLMDRAASIVLKPDFAYNIPTRPIPPQHILYMVLFVSFFQQDWLKHLDLSMNRITDDDIATLVLYLPACRQLRILRLNGNCLTKKAVKMLCFGCTDSVDAIGAAANPNALGGGLLTELDLSHNLLSDDALVPLARLCRNLSKLQVLCISSTDITHLPKNMDIKRLQTLDVSENPLTEQFVQYLLKLLGEGFLREAHLKSLPVYCNTLKPILWKTLSHNRIDVLRMLNLANCRLSDDELEPSVLPVIARNCPSLTHLDVSLNTGLTKSSFLAVLRSCAGAVFKLQEIRFEHDVQLWVDMEKYASTDELLKLIEYSPSAWYPRQIDAILPAYGYSAERYEKLLAVITHFWSALWPLRQSNTRRLADSLQVSLGVNSTS
ncbi:uncharacterized protein LOC118511589 [Anopheles stephensi]|uniref:uncharacterized protein LOC118511589 n=1 Tax=Anopheles stephensi TaxID=30069 RepID=UPI001658AB7D|nr:uncharacterized protein LOC118511589 [Anopheles stephensi]